jgi:hypothetical protein
LQNVTRNDLAKNQEAKPGHQVFSQIERQAEGDFSAFITKSTDIAASKIIKRTGQRSAHSELRNAVAHPRTNYSFSS